MLQHIMNGVTHHGFQRLTTNPAPGTTVAIIWFEGEPELWAYEGAEGLAALREYFMSDWPEHSVAVTLLTKTGDEAWHGARLQDGTN